MNDNLKKVYESARKANSNFNVPFDVFVEDMKVETNRKNFHANLPTYAKDFDVPYDKFVSDMGFDIDSKSNMPNLNASTGSQSNTESSIIKPSGNKTNKYKVNDLGQQPPVIDIPLPPDFYSSNYDNIKDNKTRGVYLQNAENVLRTFDVDKDIHDTNKVEVYNQASKFYNDNLQDYNRANEVENANKNSIASCDKNHALDENLASNQEPITNMFEAAKQGSQKMYEGGKVGVANIANVATGSARDAERALRIVEKHGENYDPLTAYKQDKKDAYDKEMEAWHKKHPSILDKVYGTLPVVGDMPDAPVGLNVQTLLKVATGDPSKMIDNMGDMLNNTFGSGTFSTQMDMRPYKLAGEALKQGDTEKAKAFLREKAGQKTWGDGVEADAMRELATMRPTEGFGAWVGELVPQMIPNALAIAAMVHPTTRVASKPLAYLGTSAQGLSAGGLAIADARQYAEETGMDIPESTIVKVGVVAGSIDAAVESIPIGKYLGEIGGAVRKKFSSQVAKDIVSNPAARSEMNSFFTKAAKEIPGLKTISSQTVKKYAGEIVEEGISEFSSEALGAMVPMLYANREDYPALSEILESGLEGAKSGIFMGGLLGGGNHFANNFAQNQRRKQQGEIALMKTKDGFVECIGQNGETYTVLNNRGEVVDIPVSSVEESHVVGWEEFNNFAKAERKNTIENNAYASLEASEKQIIKESFTQAERKFDAAFADTPLVAMKGEVLNASLEQQQEFILDVSQREDLTTEQKKAAIDLIVRGNAYNSYRASLDDVVDNASQDVAEYVEEHVNPATNSVMAARLTGHSEPVQIVGGNIVRNEDGSINEELSDKSITFIDSEGNRKPMFIRFVEEVIEEIGTEDAISQAVEAVTAPIMAQQQNEEVRTYQEGEEVRVQMGDSGLLGVISGKDENGHYIFTDTASQEQLVIEPRQIVNEDNLLGAAPGMEVQYVDANGKIRTGVMNDLYGQRMEGNVFIGDDLVPVSAVIGVVQNAGGQSDENGGQQILDSQVTEGEVKQNTTPPSEEQNKRIEIETITANAPKQKSGKIDYNALMENNPADFALLWERRAGAEATQKQLQKVSDGIGSEIVLEQKKLENETDFNKIADIDDQVNELQARKQAVDDVVASRYAEPIVTIESEESVQPTEVTKEISTIPLVDPKEKKVRKKRLTKFQKELSALENDVHTLRDNILYGIASGAYRFRWKDNGTSKGLGSELGLLDSERKARLGLLLNSGFTPATLGEYIRANSNIEVNDNEVRSEVIDILSSVTSRGQALDILRSSLRVNEDVNNQEQAEVHQFEEEQEEQRLEIQEEIADQLDEEVFVSLGNEAIDFDLGIEQVDNTQTTSDIIDVIEQLEYERKGQEDSRSVSETGAEDRGNALESEGTEAGGNTSSDRASSEWRREGRTEREISDSSGRDRTNLSSEHEESESQQGIQISDKQNNESKLTAEEQTVVDSASDEIDAEIAEVEANIGAKQTELQNKRKELGKEYAKENQTNLFPAKKTSDTLFDVDADFSKQNMESIIKPIEDELSSLINKGKDLMNDRSKRIIDALRNFRSQGNLFDAIARAEAETDTNYTEAQKKAGNYKKGKVAVQGFDISIEQPKSSVRSGKDADGKEWSVTMNNTYGYIRGTEGKDGEQIDVFLGGNPESKKVYVVDQVSQDKSFDEHKVMLGFNSVEEAREAYLLNYSAGWEGLGDITEVDVETFRKWTDSDSRRIKPFAEYKEINSPRFHAVNKKALERINTQFNEELQKQIDEELPKNHTYKLGRPSRLLQSAGIPNLPIKLRAARLADKPHPNNQVFDLARVKDLPRAIQQPIAVLESAKKDGSKMILTETDHEGHNFVVVMRVTNKGKGRGNIEISDIRSIYPKDDAEGILDWINSEDNLLRDVDKE